MGMFDTVNFKCITCEEPQFYQSKAGVCQGKNYGITSVPLSIAEEMDGMQIKCLNCGTPNLFTSPKKRINMDISTTDQGEKYD